MSWREVNWSGICWCDAGKTWWGTKTKAGQQGWDEKLLRGRMESPGVLYEKEDGKRLRWFPCLWFEYLKRQWYLCQDSGGGPRQEIRTWTWICRPWGVCGKLKGKDHLLIYLLNTFIERMFYARLWQSVGKQNGHNACPHTFYSLEDRN